MIPSEIRVLVEVVAKVLLLRFVLLPHAIAHAFAESTDAVDNFSLIRDLLVANCDKVGHAGITVLILFDFLDEIFGRLALLSFVETNALVETVLLLRVLKFLSELAYQLIIVVFHHI